MRIGSALAVLGVVAIAVASTPARADWDGFRGGGYRGGYDGGRHDGEYRHVERRRFDDYGDRDGYGYGYGPRRFGPPPVFYAPPPPFYSPPPYYFTPGY